MNDDNLAQMRALQNITQLRLDSLVQEMAKRARVVNEDALEHLIKQGVLAPLARDGCCKPDGGTCCPNARLRVAPQLPAGAK